MGYRRLWVLKRATGNIQIGAYRAWLGGHLHLGYFHGMGRGGWFGMETGASAAFCWVWRRDYDLLGPCDGATSSAPVPGPSSVKASSGLDPRQQPSLPRVLDYLRRKLTKAPVSMQARRSEKGRGKTEDPPVFARNGRFHIKVIIPSRRPRLLVGLLVSYHRWAGGHG